MKVWINGFVYLWTDNTLQTLDGNLVSTKHLTSNEITQLNNQVNYPSDYYTKKQEEHSLAYSNEISKFA